MAGPLAGCGASLAGFCANEAVASGLEIEVVDREGAQEHPRAGGYRFHVTTEVGEVEWSCEVKASDAIGSGCAADYEVMAEDGETHLLVSSVASDARFWLDLKVITSGAWRGPAEVHVEISRDGEQVADEQYMPAYALSSASGAKGCPNYYAAEGEPPTLEL